MRFLRRILRVWRVAYRAERAARSRERGQCPHVKPIDHTYVYAELQCIRPRRHEGACVFPPLLPSLEPREGLATVYDDQGRYLGCMGIELWERLVADDQTVFAGESTQP